MRLATNKFRVWHFGLIVVVWVCHSSCALAAEFGFSGMHVQGINLAIAKALGMAGPRGVLVRDVALGGPANKAGIQRGDLILHFDNTEIQGVKILVEAVSINASITVFPVILILERSIPSLAKLLAAVCVGAKCKSHSVSVSLRLISSGNGA